MKKLISFLALSFCALTVNAQATHNMKITFQDGNTVVYGMENVKSVEFVEKEEPSSKETYTINGVEYPIPEAVDLGLPSGNLWASVPLGYSESSKGFLIDLSVLLGINDFVYPHKRYECSFSNFSGSFSYCFANTEKDLANSIGNGWQTPTINDFKELRDNCKIEAAENYPDRLIKITGKNGNYVLWPRFYMWNFGFDDDNSFVYVTSDVYTLDGYTYTTGFKFINHEGYGLVCSALNVHNHDDAMTPYSEDVDYGYLESFIIPVKRQ